eukprot:3577642-Pleurochrysis_carterae.AAC.4
MTFARTTVAGKPPSLCGSKRAADHVEHRGHAMTATHSFEVRREHCHLVSNIVACQIVANAAPLVIDMYDVESACN